MGVVKRDSRLSMASKTGILLVLLGLLAGTWAQTCEDFGVVDAPPCNADANCTASQGCACSGDEPDIPLEDRPMIVCLTFDDALTQLLHTEYFTQLFDGTYSNPNGCPIRATFFLTHESNDYTLVNKYYSEGHEMASHSITHLNDPNYWEGLDVEGWRSEITDMRSMIAKYGQVAEEDIIGMRSPFLINGGDTMLSMMSEDGFTYDSTVASLEFGYFNLENGRWPYTYDYASTMDCQIPPVQPVPSLESGPSRSSTWRTAGFQGSTRHTDTHAPCWTAALSKSKTKMGTYRTKPQIWCTKC